MVRYACSCFLHLAQLTTLLLDGYILAGVQIGGLSSEFAIWCGLSKDDPRYDEELMSFWYQMSPVQYCPRDCRGQYLYVGKVVARKATREAGNVSSTGFEASKASIAATTTSPTGSKTVARRSHRLSASRESAGEASQHSKKSNARRTDRRYSHTELRDATNPR